MIKLNTPITISLKGFFLLVFIFNFFVLNIWFYIAYEIWLQNELCRSINMNKELNYIGYVIWYIDWTPHIATVEKWLVLDYSFVWKEVELNTYLNKYKDMKYNNKYDINFWSLFLLIIKFQKNLWII